MYLITVIPVARGTAVTELSYYSAVEYPLGSFIEVPVRRKSKMALVIGSEEVREKKALLRKSSFTLQKIPRQKPRQHVTQQFIRAVQRTATYHAVSVGSVLFTLLPKVLLEHELPSHEILQTRKPKLRGYIVPRVFQGLANARVEFYRTSIREAFAAKGSVFIVVPTIADAERIYKELAPGIEQYAHLVHGTLRKKEQQKKVSDILSSDHPILIVASYHFLSLPRHDLATIIVERESSSLYRARNRPYIDARVLAHELAGELQGQLFLADLPLRIESVYRRDLSEYEEIVTGHHRTHFPTRVEVCNLQGLAASPKKPFRVLSRELLDRIQSAGEQGGRTFLYVARRGLSPVTLCRDCGTVVTCRECDASVVLHKGTEENYFLCHSCGALRHARERCAHCSSWRLEAFGIGAELVEREVRDVLPDRSVGILTSDTAKNHGMAEKIASEFYNTSRSILIGTEMALPYLSKHVPVVGIVSLDSLLSLASWNIYERVAGTLTRLREIAGEELLLQTRRPEVDMLKTVLSGNFSGFYRSELKVRKQLGYPPYTVIIKVSVQGSQETVEDKMKDVSKILLPFELITFSRMLKVSGGKFALHGFIRIAREQWPNDDLLARLYALPPSCEVWVDPDSIL